MFTLMFLIAVLKDKIDSEALLFSVLMDTLLGIIAIMLIVAAN